MLKQQVSQKRKDNSVITNRMKKKGGGQPGNKNAEKWTEEKALKLGNDLIDWLSEKDEEGNEKGNIFYEEFLVIERKLYPDLTSYLSEKYLSFSDLIKKAKKIQELKLIKFGIADRLQPTMTIFVLKNHHGYTDRKEFDHLSGGKPIKPVIKFSNGDS
jgi:hypothetical protein